MFNKNASEIFEKGCNERFGFVEEADKLMTYGSFSGETGSVASALAMGSELTKDKYLSIGAGIGVLSTVAALGIAKGFQLYYKHKEVE